VPLWTNIRIYCALHHTPCQVTGLGRNPSEETMENNITKRIIPIAYN
jgi:hypothetical protein